MYHFLPIHLHEHFFCHGKNLFPSVPSWKINDLAHEVPRYRNDFLGLSRAKKPLIATTHLHRDDKTLILSKNHGPKFTAALKKF